MSCSGEQGSGGRYGNFKALVFNSWKNESLEVLCVDGGMQCSVGGDFYHHRAAVPAASVFVSAECAINDGLCRLVRDCCCHRPDFFSYGCGEEAPRSGVFGMVGCRSLYHYSFAYFEALYGLFPLTEFALIILFYLAIYNHKHLFSCFS